MHLLGFSGSSQVTVDWRTYSLAWMVWTPPGWSARSSDAEAAQGGWRRSTASEAIVGSDRKPWFIRRGTIACAAIVVVAGAGVGTWLGTRSSSAAPLITTTTTVQTVTTGTITQTVASSGTLEPASQANLDFGVSGQVTTVEVTAGQTVTAGQPLATIDPTSLNAALAQAEANWPTISRNCPPTRRPAPRRLRSPPTRRTSPRRRPRSPTPRPRSRRPHSPRPSPARWPRST